MLYAISSAYYIYTLKVYTHYYIDIARIMFEYVHHTHVVNICNKLGCAAYRRKATSGVHESFHQGLLTRETKVRVYTQCICII